MRLKILILSNDHLYANVALNQFLRKRRRDIVGLMLPNFIIPGKTYLESIRFLLKKSFSKFILYKWFEGQIFKVKLAFGLGKLKSFDYYAKKFQIPLFRINSINNQTTVAMIKKLKPDVIYSVAYPEKIGAPLLKIPKFGCINFHDSLLPKYRGLCAYFWVTANNERKSGVTAIIIEEGLDTGKIVLQRTFMIDKEETMQQVYYKSARSMGEMIFVTQNMLDKNQIRSYNQKRVGSSYYSWPSKEGFRLFKKNGKRFFEFIELWRSI